jgi:hypothetical protein
VYKYATSDGVDRQPFTLNNMLVNDPANWQKIVVARYIQECESTPDKAPIFDAIVAVFTGVLIEDFIANVQSIADKRHSKGFCVYYDTTVLLRILGTSGRLLRLAALDMHNAVQALGWSTFYFEMTNQETRRILVRVADDPIHSHPESAEAYISGEFTKDEISELPDTFADKLKRLGIRPAPSITFQKHWEIREGDLTELLVAASDTYKLQSARKDARAVANILQLRKGETSTEIGRAKHVFASSNRLLHSVTRDFVNAYIEDYEPGSIPPVLTVGQLATVAWLSTSRDIEPINASRELLTACYNAVRPSGEWIGKFAAVLDTYLKQNPEVIAEDANSNIFLRTTRLLMQDYSRGRSEPTDLPNLERAVREAREANNRTDYEIEIANARVQQLEAELSLATVRASALEQELAAAQDTATEAAPTPSALINPDVQAAEAEVLRARLMELEARAEAEKAAAAAAQQALANLRSTPQDQKLLKMICFVVILVLILGALLLSKGNLFIVIAIVVICVTLPIMWAYIFRYDELSGTDLIRSYQVGVNALPMIGGLFSSTKRNHSALTSPLPEPDVEETPTPAPRATPPKGRVSAPESESSRPHAKGQGKSTKPAQRRRPS